MIRLYFKIGSYFKSKLNKVSLIRNIFAKFLPHLTDTKENKNLKLKSISQKEMSDTFNLFLKADKKKTKISIKKLSYQHFIFQKMNSTINFVKLFFDNRDKYKIFILTVFLILTTFLEILSIGVLIQSHIMLGISYDLTKNSELIRIIEILNFFSKSIY